MKGVWVGIASAWMASAADAESRLIVDGDQQRARARVDFKIVIPGVARMQLGNANTMGSHTARGARRKLMQRTTGAMTYLTNAGDVSLTVTPQLADDFRVAPSGVASSLQTSGGRNLQPRVVYTMALP